MVQYKIIIFFFIITQSTIKYSFADFMFCLLYILSYFYVIICLFYYGPSSDRYMYDMSYYLFFFFLILISRRYKTHILTITYIHIKYFWAAADEIAVVDDNNNRV